MGKKSFFQVKENVYPQIYVYSDDRFLGSLKVGYTTRKNVEDRIREQYPLALPTNEKPYHLLFHTESIKEDGSVFTDKNIHHYLVNKKFKYTSEWFKCSLDDVKAAVIAIKNGIQNVENRTQTFKMRPEQEEAVNKTVQYFVNYKSRYLDRAPHFLWNAKMRFGKTFACYHLALKMEWTKILVITYKPVVESAWKEDLLSHVDFEGWQFAANDAMQFDDLDLNKPYICFGSFQDFLGRTHEGEIKVKNEWIHLTKWDCVIFDEYHFGAWRDTAKELFEDESDEDVGVENIDEGTLPIVAGAYLYLSGTPFRAIETGEFAENQIFNWTYSDEQRAKENWIGENNPYASLPQIMLLTYRLPDAIREVALKGEFNEFDLNYFFKATGIDENAKFINENEAQKWLDLIRGAFAETTIDNLKLGAEKPPFPYDDVFLKKILNHTVWFLPNIASCYAMYNLMQQPQNTYYHDFKIVVAAGTKAGVGIKALQPVQDAMGNPLKTKTITLTCGKLTTGVTIKPWTGILMLRSLKTPETYFQAAFRVQSPWVISGEDGFKILKTQCFIFDFDPNRALSQIAMYADKLDKRDVSSEVKVQEFIHYLPVLAYDGFAMEQVDAAGLLDIAMGRTTATLLAKGWNNALLVNVDTDTLRSLASSEEAMEAINSIEGFRNAKEDFNIIISKADSIKKLKNKKAQGTITSKEKKQLSEDEKIYKNNRDVILKKLKTLATRIPLFMYLTDKREENLKDVITKLEPELFKRVTGLCVEDFDLLISLGLFNSQLMNLAVRNFRKYEDASMSYSGIDRHKGNDIGLFDMIVSEKEYKDESIRT